MSQELDPYEILQINYDADIVEIRNNFKRLILLHHPDKGGNPQQFQIIKQAYAYLYKQKKEEDNLNQRQQMTRQQYIAQRSDPYNNPNNQQNNRQQRNQQNNQQQRNQQNNQQQRNQQNNQERNDLSILNPQSFDISNFNTVYKQNRLSSATDDGYGNIMDESSQSREEVDQLAKSTNLQQFKNQELVIYDEPEAISSMKQEYQELGVDKISDFSNKNLGRNIHYTDYMNAYSKQHEMTQNTKNVRNQDFKDVNDLISNRNNISYEMNEKDLRKEELRKKIKLRKEQRRKFNLHNDDEQVYEQYEKMKRFIKN